MRENVVEHVLYNKTYKTKTQNTCEISCLKNKNSGKTRYKIKEDSKLKYVNLAEYLAF